MKSENKKPVIAMDRSTKGKGGGPFTSTTRIMESGLSQKYDFVELRYDPSMGSGVSVKRILDLRRQIKQVNPDIVHFTGLQLSGFHVAVACFLARVKNTVVTIRGMSGDAIDFHPVKRFMLTWLFEPLTMLLAKRFTGVSDFVTSRKIARVFAYKCFGTVYNFPPEQEVAEPKVQLRSEFGFTDDDIVIASIGRINKEKGYHILKQAIERFTGNDKVKFLIAGDGDYLVTMKSELQTQIDKGQVVLLGYRDDVQRINGAADIFVLPTLHETLSVALLEASKAGLALVASDTGGVPEIVETGYNGELVTTGDADMLYGAMEKLVSRPALVKEYGSNALTKVNSKFSKQSIECKLEQLYAQLLSK